MRKVYTGIITVLFFLTIAGCGRNENDIVSKVDNVQPIISTEESEAINSESIQQDVCDSADEDTMYVYSEMDKLKNYDTVDDLLDDACALVKVEVLQADSENVRSYVYTSYDMKILDILYGDIGESGSTINVNMPGGTIQGNEAQEMISEVTDGKDAGDLSGIDKIASSGNTDYLLAVGDVAYLFLIPESDTSYAVVGEYCGEMLLDSGTVIFDSNIIGFEEGISINTFSVDEQAFGSVSENEFVNIMEEMIANR